MSCVWKARGGEFRSPHPSFPPSPSVSATDINLVWLLLLIIPVGIVLWYLAKPARPAAAAAAAKPAAAAAAPAEVAAPVV